MASWSICNIELQTILVDEKLCLAFTYKLGDMKLFFNINSFLTPNVPYPYEVN